MVALIHRHSVLAMLMKNLIQPHFINTEDLIITKTTINAAKDISS